ncbi:DUF4328 domain-containing protein [Actinacidiphila glaucinigra]|uniref:DUF4328 domain-containing protein n=1 Tax=Actinacidiphila glaucinigra TaxID=235986 RepID=UPI002DDC28C9|nr:DUF4328 domain-containing protein [Actinacidiphila glaucinigra]WSD63702.1 DUF4328 domain-containing protein [Actinacidiphila glaucinigra]
MSFSPAGPPPGAQYPAPYPVPVGPPATTAVLRSPLGLATAVVVLLSLVIAADVLDIVAEAGRYALMDTAVGDVLATVDQSALNRSDLWIGVAAALQFLTLVGAAVLFVIWFHRVRTNGEVFAPNGFEKGRGWAIGGWFIPIGNLWIPSRIARETWVASSQTTQDGRLRPADSGPVAYWWAAWVASELLSWLSVLVTNGGSQYADDLRDAAGFAIAADAVDILAAVLAILFVRKLTAMQHRKATEGPFALS